MRGPGYIIDDLVYDAANLRASICELEPTLALRAPGSIERLKELMDEAERLELQFEVFDYWKDGPDERWHVKIIDNSSRNFSGRNESIINAPGAPNYIHLYTSIMKALNWNLYHATRLMLSQKIITCLRQFLYLDPISSQEPTLSADIPSDVDIAYLITLHDRAETVVDKMIEDICASVAYHITPLAQHPSNVSAEADAPAVYGFFLLWPLIMMLASTQSARVGHYKNGRWEWIRNVLEYIDRGMGISQARVRISTFY